MPVNPFDNYYMSWRPTLSKDDKPKYRTLARKLEEDIVSGKLRPGTRLPPQRELADFLDINLSTVQRAFRICSDKGLLSGNVGSGTFVSYALATDLLNERTSKNIPLDITGPYPIDISEMDTVIRELRKNERIDEFFRYMPKDLPRYQQGAAEVLKKVGCDISPDKVLFSNGGQNALAAIFAGVFRPGDKIGTDPLTYSNIKMTAQTFGVQLYPIEWEGGHVSEEGIQYAVRNYGIKGLYLQPFLHNPTGLVMEEEARRMVASVSIENDLTVIEDGMYNSFITNIGNTIYRLAPDNTIFIFSLSKTVNPAMRLRYVAAGEKYNKAVSDALYSINLTPSPLLMELAYRLSVDGGMDELINRRMAGIVERNRIADGILGDHGLMPNPINPHRWLLLPEGVSSLDFEKRLKERGVSVWASERFSVGHEVTSEAIRLSVCGPESGEELERGLEIIREELEAVR